MRSGTLESLSHLRRQHLHTERRKRPHLVRGVFLVTAVSVSALVFIPFEPLRTELDIVCSAVSIRTADSCPTDWADLTKDVSGDRVRAHGI